MKTKEQIVEELQAYIYKLSNEELLMEDLSVNEISDDVDEVYDTLRALVLEEAYDHICELCNGEFEHCNPMDYVSCDDLEGMDFDELTEKIENAFYELEIIGYYNAMEYLTENDESLRDSLELAHDCGYHITDLSSETLATLHAQRREREAWDNLSDWIGRVLSDMNETLDNLDANEIENIINPEEEEE